MLVVCATAFGTASTLLIHRHRFTPIAGGLAAALLAAALGPVPLLVVLLLAVPLAIRLAEIDLLTLRLPDRLVGALGLSIGLPLTLGYRAAVPRAAAAAALLGFGYLVIALAPGRGLGLGDVKLAAVLGYLLGFAGWPAVLIGAVVPHLLAGPVAVFLLLTGRAGRRTAVPLGPALLAGGLIAAVATGRWA